MKMLVFKGTNGTAGAIVYNAAITTNLVSRFGPPTVGDIYGSDSSGRAAPGEGFTFYLPALPKEPPWRILWAFGKSESALTPWENRRLRCAEFLRQHGMPNLARRIDPGLTLHSIPSSEIKK
jgi:hypothetical protein